MSKASEALRGLRGFGPEHWVHLEALIAERDKLLSELEGIRLLFGTILDSTGIDPDETVIAAVNSKTKTQLASVTLSRVFSLVDEVIAKAKDSTS